ncbi:GNAT family N-acetyltransferase [Saccharomonospora sp. NPDC006951]
MSDLVTRVLRDDELRAANTLFRAALHAPPVKDEEWETTRRGHQPERTLGVFDDALIGTAKSTDALLRVPGGADVPLAAVTGVGVRADRTRRGVLTSLMRAQFADFTERGIVVAALHASEGAIYGRFGYGVGTLMRSYKVRRLSARLRSELPASGEIELLDIDAALSRLPGIYAGLPLRPGMMSRPRHWWYAIERGLRAGEEPLVTAVHHGTDGIDGFVVYRVVRTPGGDGTLKVDDLHYGTPEAFAGLWRFLLGVDLVGDIEVGYGPVTEPVELLFTDPRMCKVTEVEDDTWLRLIDVEAALLARERRSGPLVIEVDDPFLPRNACRYLITPDEVTRTERDAQLRMGADTLAMAYLGAWLPSALAETGRIRVSDPGAVAIADDLFGARSTPWCGTFF